MESSTCSALGHGAKEPLHLMSRLRHVAVLLELVSPPRNTAELQSSFRSSTEMLELMSTLRWAAEMLLRLHLRRVTVTMWLSGRASLDLS